jgi:hypothetical protein
MQFLHLLKVVQEASRFLRVVTAPLQLRDQLLLAGNMTVTEGDVPFDDCKVPFQHFPVHTVQ